MREEEKLKLNRSKEINDKKKIAKRNRQRGKRVQKKAEKVFGGLDIGVLGKVDVVSDRFIVECKSRKSLAIDKWFQQLFLAKSKHKMFQDKVPLLLCHQYKTKKYYAVLQLKDFLSLLNLLKGLTDEGGNREK